VAVAAAHTVQTIAVIKKVCQAVHLRVAVRSWVKHITALKILKRVMEVSAVAVAAVQTDTKQIAPHVTVVTADKVLFM
jgi:hypothetical protein